MGTSDNMSEDDGADAVGESDGAGGMVDSHDVEVDGTSTEGHEMVEEAESDSEAECVNEGIGLEPESDSESVAARIEEQKKRWSSIPSFHKHQHLSSSDEDTSVPKVCALCKLQIARGKVPRYSTMHFPNALPEVDELSLF